MLLMRANESHFHSIKWGKYVCRCQCVSLIIDVDFNVSFQQFILSTKQT